jgi:type I restriction enzyme S subunit
MNCVPKLRFKEFMGGWEEKILNNIVKFSKGKGISKNDISENGLECIRYGELYTTYEEKISKIVSKTNLDSKNLILSEKYDIIIPTSGETAIDLATASCIMKENVAIGGDTTILKTNENSLFLSYYLNNKRNKIATLAQGASVVHLYASLIKNLKINLPSLEEQTKIANFLTVIDEKIGFLTKTHNLLKTYKKGITWQIFTQKLRFKEFMGGWEEKRLGDIVIINKGIQLNKDDMIDKGEYHVLNGGIEPSGFTNKPNTPKNTITISEGGSCGYVNYNFENFWAGGHCYTIENINQEINKLFLFQELKYLERHIMRLRVGSALPNIQKKDLNNFIVKIPVLEEQEKIANFLSNIDEKIEEIDIELNLFKEFKKGLLQKMFC